MAKVDSLERFAGALAETESGAGLEWRPRHEGAKESKWNAQMAALRGDQLDQKGRARRPKHRIGK